MYNQLKPNEEKLTRIVDFKSIYFKEPEISIATRSLCKESNLNLISCVLQTPHRVFIHRQSITSKLTTKCYWNLIKRVIT